MKKTDLTIDELQAAVAKLRKRVAELEELGERAAAQVPDPEESGSLLRLSENLRDVFWLTDWESNRVLYVSPAYEAVWGVPPESLYHDSRSWLDPIHPEDRERVHRAFAEEAVKGRYDIEYRILHPDGSMRWIHDRAFPIRDSEGRVVRMGGISEDITDRKQSEDEARLHADWLARRQKAIVDLATDRAVVEGDLVAAARRITETVADILDIGRVGVWMFDEKGTRLRCIDQFVRDPNTHSAGTELQAESYPAYFAALTSGRVVDAHDACGDPRTSEFKDGYLNEMGITSMMDAAIRVSGRTVGVVCHEHVGPIRNWNAGEIAFAGEVADQAAQAVQNAARRKGELALREIQERLLEAQRMAGIGSYVWDIPKDEVWWSEGHYQLFGEDPERYTPSYAGFMTRVHEEDVNRLEADVRAAVESGGPFASEFRACRADGSWMHIDANGQVLRDAHGNALRMSGTCQDITERKRNEERQLLMVRELDHRVKNTLATVLAITRQTRESATTLEAFCEAFEGRIAAMAQVHEALARRRWDGASLTELVERSLAPYGSKDVRWTLRGEELILPYPVVAPLSMGLHELVTNAAKYGALTTASGSVEVAWEELPGESRRIRLTWTERGGPPVAVPEHRGFGTTLIEQGLAYELGGEVRLEFLPEGLRCTLEFGLSTPSDGPGGPGMAAMRNFPKVS